MTKKIFVTFDYELYLGPQSGTVDQCLIQPMTHLLPLLKKHGVQATFFFDATYYWMLQQKKNDFPSLSQDCEKIEANVATLLKEGHDIQLHLHPHWLDATTNGKEWSLNQTKRYRLHALSSEDKADDINTILGCVSLGKKLLEEMGAKTKPGYKVTAFRAGGWALEPFDAIRGALAQNQIFVDSSVASGIKLKVSDHEEDYSHFPNKDHWRFEASASKEDPNGSFLEIPISTIQGSLVQKIKRRAKNLLMDKESQQPWGKGQGVPSPSPSFLSRLASSQRLFSFEGHTFDELQQGFLQQGANSFEWITLISHPKQLSPDTLSQMDLFFTWLQSQNVAYWPFSHVKP